MSIKSYIKSVCLGLAVLAGAVSCTSDLTPQPIPEDSGSALVKLSIYTPTSSVPKATRAADSADECEVSDIKLVVLELSGSTYRYRYMVDGQQIKQDVSDTQITTFNALLTSSDVPLKILLVANYNDAFDNGQLAEDMDEAGVKQWLTDSFDDGMAGRLPLYGEISLSQLKADQPNSFSVTMLRAVARVDVNNNVDPSSSEDFKLESVHIYRANDRYSFAPTEYTAQTEQKITVTAPTIPAGASVYGPYNQQVENDGDVSIIKTYLPESYAVTDASKQTSTATCVVVGGWFADDAQPTYYRIDFDSGNEGHPFGQVLRNHKYVFNILGVNERGWPTPKDAAENEATAIIATMQVWDELTSEMWFYGNDNYLGISSRRVVLNYFAGSEKTETLQATVPFSIQPLDGNGNPVGTPITTAGQTFTSGFYKLELVKDNTDGEDVWRLVITSTGDNYTAEEFSGKFQVFTDWWTFDVEVVQETYQSQREGKYVRILTITDLYGDLGTTDGTFTEGSGNAMRRVLENTANFSPAGTVVIGGIVVYDLKNATISTDNASDMYILRKVLNDVDVVHLADGCTPSVTAANLIAEWHESKPNRVLIIGLDDQITNANLRDYIYEVEGTDPDDPSSGTWEVNTTVTELGLTPADMGSERFLNGPFGDVQSGTMGLSRPLQVGYNNGYNWESTISLLMIKEAQDNQSLMTHGVNTGAGIFYCGDSGVTTGNGAAMSSQAVASGTVTSDFDRLMANVWAWIVERVAMVSENV